MTDLPPLPEPTDLLQITWRGEREFAEPIGDYFTADQMRAYAAAARAQALDDAAGSHDLEAMCEAFSRVIEAHANKHSPFHQPINADAMMALRVLRGVVSAIRAMQAPKP